MKHRPKRLRPVPRRLTAAEQHARRLARWNRQLGRLARDCGLPSGPPKMVYLPPTTRPGPPVPAHVLSVSLTQAELRARLAAAARADQAAFYALGGPQPGPRFTWTFSDPDPVKHVLYGIAAGPP